MTDRTAHDRPEITHVMTHAGIRATHYTDGSTSVAHVQPLTGSFPIHESKATMTPYERVSAMIGTRLNRRLTEAELVKLHHAVAEAEMGRITAKIAVGTLIGINQEWPEGHRKAALRTFELESLA
jgi:hypothetical protein